MFIRQSTEKGTAELKEFQKKRIFTKQSGEIEFNYTVIGAYSSKTALIKQYKEGVLLPLTHPFVVGVDLTQLRYVDKNNRSLLINLYDTAEHVSYLPMTSTYVSSALCAIIVIEMEWAIMDNIQFLVDQNKVLKDSIDNPHFVTAIIGCYRKNELLKLSHDDLIQFAHRNKIDASLCFDVNITNKEQIDAVFNSINDRVISLNKLGVDHPELIIEHEHKEKNSWRC